MMKRMHGLPGCLLLLSLLFALPAGASAEGVQIKSRVTDNANVLHKTVKIQLYQLLVQFGTAHGKNLYVVTATSSGDATASEYQRAIWQQWESKRKEHSVMLLLLRDQKVAAIMAGEALKAELDEATIQQIIQGSIAPRLEQGDFSAAAMDGAVEILTRLRPRKR